jgi:hypothetical protein
LVCQTRACESIDDINHKKGGKSERSSELHGPISGADAITQLDIHMATLQRVIVLGLLMAVALADQPVQFNCTTLQQTDLAKGVTWQQMNWSAFICVCMVIIFESFSCEQLYHWCWCSILGPARPVDCQHGFL